MESDAGQCSVLVLLDFNGAFETIDHGIVTLEQPWSGYWHIY